MPLYCSIAFHGSHCLPSLDPSAWLSGVSRIHWTFSLPRPSLALPVQSLNAVPFAQTIPLTWMPITLVHILSVLLGPFPSWNLFDSPDFRIAISFSDWATHSATELYIILFSNCSMYVYLVSQLYFDLRESRACLLPLCPLQIWRSK